MFEPPNTYNGFKIVESTMLTQDGDPYEVNRSLKERLFTLPWCPLKKEFDEIVKRNNPS